jgi:hypothetical protein
MIAELIAKILEDAKQNVETPKGMSGRPFLINPKPNPAYNKWRAGHIQRFLDQNPNLPPEVRADYEHNRDGNLDAANKSLFSRILGR